MAYGQTFSGKTHTMKGTLECPGIVPLALSDIFDTIKAQEISAKIEVSYL
jgi:centromeric protein E